VGRGGRFSAETNHPHRGIGGRVFPHFLQNIFYTHFRFSGPLVPLLPNQPKPPSAKHSEQHHTLLSITGPPRCVVAKRSDASIAALTKLVESLITAQAQQNADMQNVVAQLAAKEGTHASHEEGSLKFELQGITKLKVDGSNYKE
jgi:hypothetical protein